jgi:hypothetical protein
MGMTMILCLSAAGCVVAPVMPPWGTLYTDVYAPLDLGTPGEQGKRIGPHEGRARSVAYAGLVAVGDASLRAAVRQGELRTVTHIDYRFQNYCFGLFTAYTTIAYGE